VKLAISATRTKICMASIRFMNYSARNRPSIDCSKFMNTYLIIRRFMRPVQINILTGLLS
jgi:hypothetical protein